MDDFIIVIAPKDWFDFVSLFPDDTGKICGIVIYQASGNLAAGRIDDFDGISAVEFSRYTLHSHR